MDNDFFLGLLAKERQSGFLQEAENNRLLRQAGMPRPKWLKRRLPVVLCMLAPVALVAGVGLMHLAR
jgi:hypothetical protein